MQTPRISEMGLIRKMDPYVTTQKLDYIDIHQVNNREKQAKIKKNNKYFRTQQNK